MRSPIIIGTRGSELALWQANFTKSELEKNGIAAELKIIKTKGDTTQEWNTSFNKLEGKGFFTKELEEELLAGDIDLAVHSCKDLPTENPQGLIIAAYSKRANPFDILIIRKDKTDETNILKLCDNAIVGTSSARRKAQLLAFRNDIDLKDIRGNVPTRINKLRNHEFDAIVLAAAGVERLNINLDEFYVLELKAPMFVPAPAQGVLAFQIRDNDAEMMRVCQLLNDTDSAVITTIERDLLHEFEGGCQIPLGVFSKIENELVHTWISYATAWNEVPKRTLFVSDAASHLMHNKEITQKLKNQQAESVFITSDLHDDDYLVRVLRAHGYAVDYASFIEFKPVDFEFPKDANWLFFSSKNGVKYFFNSEFRIQNSDFNIAAINQGTAQSLYELGLQVDFIGEGSDLQKIAADFDAVASGKIVFAQAKKSMQSIQKGLVNNKNAESLTVYENKPKENIGQRSEEILIFTSPMSVEAYFSKYKPENFQRIVSIGKTTTKKLQEFAVNNVKTAFEPSNWCIIDEVMSV